MHGAQPPIASFGRLAQLAFECEHWPLQHRPKHKSLSTLFSKLDRKIDLDWLRDRGEVQVALAELVGRPLGDIRDVLGEAPNLGDERFLRLWDIRYARQIDLGKEALPPGIPPLVGDPPSWNRSWWIAPKGSGRSLTGQWLKARGIAHVLEIRSKRELSDLPPRGPVYIEVGENVEGEDFVLTAEDMHSLRFLDRPVCVAASFSPTHEAFHRFTSPDPRSYLPELVDWVAVHLDGRGHFSPEKAELWIRRVALSAKEKPTFGELLGLLGMLDEVSPRSISAKSLEEIAGYFVESRVREATAKQGFNPRIAGEAFPALCECSARLLADVGSPVESGRDISEWTALLTSSQNEEVPDADWFTAALKGGLGTQISKRDLRRAARKLPPAAFELSRSLKLAGILHPVSRQESGAEQLLKLGPDWLVSVLMSLSTLFVTRLPGSVWGGILLTKSGGDDLCASLLKSALRGDFSCIFALLDDDEEPSIARDAAVEAAVITCGLASLHGAELPDEVAEGLLELSAEHVLLVRGVPEPRLVSESVGPGFFQREIFLVALLELCRRVPYPLRGLDPIRAGSRAVASHFESATLQFLSRKNIPLNVRARALRLVSILGERGEDPPPSERPACLRFLRAHEDGALGETLEHCSADLLVLAMMAEGRSESRALERLWKNLTEHPTPEQFFENEAKRKVFWQHMPLDAFLLRLASGLPIPFDELLPHQYSELLRGDHSRLLPRAGAAACPLDLALTLLERDGPAAFQTDTLTELLGRAEGRIAAYVERLVQARATPLLESILAAAPPALSASLADSLPDTARLLNSPGEMVDLLRSYFLTAVRERHPGFRRCHERLTELEMGVGALKRLR